MGLTYIKTHTSVTENGRPGHFTETNRHEGHNSCEGHAKSQELTGIEAALLSRGLAANRHRGHTSVTETDRNKDHVYVTGTNKHRDHLSVR